MRTLGAELLAVFTKAQSQVDNKLDAIQSQVPQVRWGRCQRVAGLWLQHLLVTGTCGKRAGHVCSGNDSSSTTALRSAELLMILLQVCRAARAALDADRKEQKLQATVERRKAGDKLAVPNPLDLVARR